MRLQVIKTLITPRLSIFVPFLILSVIIVFIPDLLKTEDIVSLSHTNFTIFENYTLFSLSTLVSKSVQCAVFFIISLFLMNMSVNLQIIPICSAIPFIISMIIFSCIDYFHYFNNETIAFILLILSFRQLLLMYNIERQYSNAFNIAFLLSLAAIFKSEYALLLPMFLIGFMIFSAFSLRVLLAFLSGIILLAFIVFSAFFIVGATDTLLTALTSMDFYGFTPLDYRHSDFMIVISLTIILLWSFIAFFTTSSNHKLNVRVNFIFINTALIVSYTLMLVINPQLNTLMLIPSLFIILQLSLYFSTNYKKVANIVFIYFTLLCISYRAVWLLGF